MAESWKGAQLRATSALKQMNAADGGPQARQYLLIARSAIADAVRLDPRELPKWRREEAA